METKFANATATTTFKDRLAVLVEADYNDESGGEIQQKWATLTRLDNERHSGVAQDENTQKIIGVLADTLQRKASKQVFVSTESFRRLNRRPVRQQGILTDPLGPYYTKLSMDFGIYGTEEVNAAWDTNPIEAVELSMIPVGVTTDKLRSHRLSRCMAVTLHFQSPSYSDVFSLLLNLGIKLDCRVLELRNITATEAMLTILKNRLQWPSLQNIITAKRS